MDYIYIVSENNATITRYTGSGGNITIPSTITEGSITYNVTAIGDGAFSSCEKLTGVTIPVPMSRKWTVFFCDFLKSKPLNLQPQDRLSQIRQDLCIQGFHEFF